MRRFAKWRELLRREMLRPFIHLAFTRFVLALAAALLLDFFLRPSVGRDLREDLFLLFSALFALFAFVAFLRLDGVKLPRLMTLRINPRKKRSRMYGDMADYLEDSPDPAFEDLEDDEKDACLLGADLVCCLGFLAASLLV